MDFILVGSTAKGMNRCQSGFKRAFAPKASQANGTTKTTSSRAVAMIHEDSPLARKQKEMG